MAIDFSAPVKTGNYDTGILGVIRDNQFALACFLDGIGAINGSPAAGIKRYNASSSLFEKWTGTQYVEMPLAYLKLAGGTMAGPLMLAGNGTAPNHATTVGQVSAALNAKVDASALGAYAALAGAAFSGSISVAGNITGAANLAISNAFSAASAALVANGPNALQILGSSTNSIGLVIANGSRNYVMGLSGTAGPAPNGSLFVYDGVAGATRGFVDINGGLTWTGSVLLEAGAMIEGALSLRYGSATVGPSLVADGSNALHVLSTTGDSNAQLDDATGAFVSRGLLYGRGGGAGLGQITVQYGGGPSGGADGDQFFIYS